MARSIDLFQEEIIMNTKIKVLLADDTLIAREGWKRILETTDDMEVVGEAKKATETLRKVRELKPDVLLMDLKWFGDETAGWAAIQEIKQELKIKIIAVTAFENLIRDARLAGADAALLKTFTREELLGEIREQASRPENAPISLNPVSMREIITDREQQVLQLVGEGRRDKEIAKLLNIAPTTAKNHVKKILEKLNAENRTQAVSIAREMGLLK
jgi:two-component system, NarL family, response regulator